MIGLLVSDWLRVSALVPAFAVLVAGGIVLARTERQERQP